jgi:DNA repair protein RadA/Sms
VLTLEGERFGALRLLRAAKNRFGSTEEVGVLEMTEAGLRAVPDPGRAFLGEAANGAAGVAVGATLEGTRPLLIEVQTLVSRVAFGMPRRTVAGLDGNRLALLVAVLGRHAGVPLGDHDVYASLAGGASVGEPALDLPLALALASSLRDRPVRAGLAACGEVSLLGGLRPVRGLDRRLREAARLGFTEAIVPADDRGGPAPRPGTWPAGLRVTRVGSLREAIAVALAPGDGDAGRPEAAPRGKPADGP